MSQSHCLIDAICVKNVYVVTAYSFVKQINRKEINEWSDVTVVLHICRLANQNRGHIWQRQWKYAQLHSSKFNHLKALWVLIS